MPGLGGATGKKKRPGWAAKFREETSKKCKAIALHDGEYIAVCPGFNAILVQRSIVEPPGVIRSVFRSSRLSQSQSPVRCSIASRVAVGDAVGAAVIRIHAAGGAKIRDFGVAMA